MAPPRHNLFDAEGSDEGESDVGYDSEEARQESRVSRAPKKRRLEEEQNEDEDDFDSQEEEAKDIPNRTKSGTAINVPVVDPRFDINDDFDEDASERPHEEEEEDEGVERVVSTTRKLKEPRKLAKSKLPATKSGVVYLSRVPPFMKPQTVKHLLTSFGEIGRIFLTPEDPASHTRRVKSGGNKKKTFSDGWVEFIHKKDAKLAAETLNAQIIGGKKGGYYHDDIWNLKYLQGFKWHHLTEQIANENAERGARLRTEISQTTRENKRFIENVERAKILETKEAKKRKRDEKDPAAEASQPTESKKSDRNFKSQFRQSVVRSKSAKGHGAVEQPAEVQRVLAKIL